MPHFLQPDLPALVLAPMEGVTDFPMRELLTQTKGFTYCVSEFLRVSELVPPEKVFLKHIPELKTGCVTKSGTPVQIQLLGGNAERLAKTALLAIELGAKGIDLNFGCPAPTVNRHDGGATLLKHPDRLFEIVKAVRAAVPAALPVSAKVRLGWSDPKDIFLNAKKVEEAGASWITIHSRTREQGYQPPVFWEIVAEVMKTVSIPVIVNGDIWNLDDFKKCREMTGAKHYMIGRGVLSQPSLVQEIACELGLLSKTEINSFQTKQDWLPLLNSFSEICESKGFPKLFALRRIKQFLSFANRRSRIDWFNDVKTADKLEQFFSYF